jgi:hypothetical protein
MVGDDDRGYLLELMLTKLSQGFQAVCAICCNVGAVVGVAFDVIADG